ncbi:MAG: hypothetical protein ACE5G9_08595 [Nitrospinales bacterium]
MEFETFDFVKDYPLLTGACATLYLWLIYSINKKRAEARKSNPELEAKLDKANRLLESNSVRDALGKYHELLKCLSRDEEPDLYGKIKNNMGVAYFYLSLESNKKLNLNKALDAYMEALQARKSDKMPVDHAMTQNNIGTTYRALSDVGNRERNLERSIAAHNDALKIFRKKKFPIAHATTKNYLGLSYASLSEIRDPEEYLDKAVTVHKEALKIFEKEKQFEECENVKINLEKVSQTLSATREKKAVP